MNIIMDKNMIFAKGIVCAVSAPIEGTEFIERKNNDSNVHCLSDGGSQNIVPLPNVYDVVISNSSDCAWQKFTNRTNSFFYEYFNKQCRDSKNTSCSIMESVSPGKKKRFRSKGDFPPRKKRSLQNGKRAFETKTLRPPLLRKPDSECQVNECRKYNYDPKARGEACLRKIMKRPRVKAAAKKPAKCTATDLNHKSDLNSKEKRMFFRLKSLSEPKKLCKGCKGHKRHLDRLKVDDELDLNKRIEKLVKQIALENQRKESTEKDLKLSDRIQDEDMERNSFEEKPAKKPASFPFFNHIRKMFSFSKNYFNNKLVGVNSVPVDSVLDKGLIADKSSHISSYDLLKTMRKTTRFRRSYNLNHLRFKNKGKTVPVYQNDLTQKSYPFSANFKGKSRFLGRRSSRKFIPRGGKRKRKHSKRKIARRRGRKIKNWLTFKKLHFRKADKGLRLDDLPMPATDPDATQKEGISGKLADSGLLETEKSTKSSVFCSRSKSKRKKWNEKKTTKGVTASEEFTGITVNSVNEVNLMHDDTEDDMRDHTLERPSLQQHFGRNIHGKTLDYSAITEIPSPAATDIQTTPIYNSERPKKYLTTNRYLQIRHALRNYLIHNNVLVPVRRAVSPERKKRCGGSCCSCSRPSKCWRAAPLLCIPYIKKGQDDQLRFLIKIMQSMLGKPFPQKLDIFERTKFKPQAKKFADDIREYPEDDYPDYSYERPRLYYRARPPQFYPPPTQAYPPAPAYPPPICAPQPTFIPLPAYPPPTCLPPTCLPPTYPTPTCLPPTYPTPTCPTPTCPATVYCPNVCGSPQGAYSTYAAPFTVNSQICDSFTTAANQDPTGTEVSLQDLSLSVPEQSTNFFEDITAPTFEHEPHHTPVIPTLPLASNDWSVYTSTLPPTSVTPKNTPPTFATPSYSSSTSGISTATTEAVHKFTSTGNGYRFLPGMDTEDPLERREYFSFSTFTYGSGIDGGRESYQVSEKVTDKITRSTAPPFPLSNNQKLYPQTSCETCSTTHSATSEPQTTPLSQSTKRFERSTRNFKSQLLQRQGQSHRTFYPYYLRNSYMRSGRLKTSMPRTQVTAAQYEDRFDPPTERNLQNSRMQYEINQNRLFRMHHRGNHSLRQRYRTPRKYYDYDFYDQYIVDDPTEFNKQPPLSSSWREAEKNIKEPKEIEKRSKSTRHKRGDDYYSGPERFQSYNDYLDDPVFSDENLNVYSEENSKTSDQISDWTPPSFAMFSELAKAVTILTTPTPPNTSTAVNNQKNFTLETTEDSATGRDSETLYQRTTANNSTGDTCRVDKTEMPDDISDSYLKTSNQRTIPSNSDSSSLPGEYDFNSDVNATEATPGTTQVSTRRKTVFFTLNKQTKSISDKQTVTTEGTYAADVTDDSLMTDSARLTTVMNPKVDDLIEDKGLQLNHNLDSVEEGQTPTTLKMANIAKGQKKLAAKPSPKVFTKVFPDSLSCDPEVNETTYATKAPTATTVRAKTAALSSTSAVDLKLQILAVCEGYLEVIKLLKSQNHTPGEDLDRDLAGYCENIISQSFNYQSEKSKRPETSEPVLTTPAANGSPKPDDNLAKEGSYEAGNDLFESEVPDKVDDSVTEKGLGENGKKKAQKKKKRKNFDNPSANSTDIESSDKTGKRGLRKKKKRRKSHSSEKGQEKEQTTDDTDPEKIVTKGVTQEQMELIKLLRRRKEALLSWLFNSKDDGKPSEMQETEYFDDEDIMEPGSDAVQDSGTVKLKTDEKISGTTGKTNCFVNESNFPIYAKQYGYDSGGEVREVEVLWRKVNEKTHEKKIFKNVSVLALLLTSTHAEDLCIGDTTLDACESEECSAIRRKCYPATKTPPAFSVAGCINLTSPQKSPKKNATHTFITRPDASTILGKAPNANKTHRNITRKASHRLGVAKGIFQEYSIEFLNYAVYILPVMFTILFLFCCLCCAVHIFYTRKKLKKKKKKKKRQISPEETTDTTDDSEFNSKKRKREAKRKRMCVDACGDNFDSKRNKKFWNVLKLNPSRQCSEVNGSKTQTENKRSFLRFLKARKEEDKFASCSRFPLCEVEEVMCLEEKHHDSDDQHWGKKKDEERSKKGENEAAERRELIALLEELKKIETEHTEEKKEVKSVHVQYVTQEDDKSVFERPDLSYPYQENVFGLPKGYSFCSKQSPLPSKDLVAARDYELYNGVNELTELLPCECGYLTKGNDYFRLKHDGRCKRFLKIFQDSSVNRGKPFVNQNCKTDESENRRFIFNKYRSISTEDSDGLMGVTYKNAGTEVRFMENSSPLTIRPQKNANLVEEMENFKRQLNKKKNVRLKDDGVLCRL